MCGSTIGLLMVLHRSGRRERLSRRQSCTGTLQQAPKLVYPRLRSGYWLDLCCNWLDEAVRCGVCGRLGMPGAAS